MWSEWHYWCSLHLEAVGDTSVLKPWSLWEAPAMITRSCTLLLSHILLAVKTDVKLNKLQGRGDDRGGWSDANIQASHSPEIKAPKDDSGAKDIQSQEF